MAALHETESKKDEAPNPPALDTMPKKRAFRSEESYEAEAISRGMILPFLEERGFTSLTDERKTHGKSESQRVRGLDPAGRSMTLCIFILNHLSSRLHSKP